MSITRDILFESEGAIREVICAVNAALAPETPLKVRTVSSDYGSWEVADGVACGYPLILMDTSGLETETTEGLAWHLSVRCLMEGGEEDDAFDARCDADADAFMRRLGSALRVRCVLLDDLQTRLGAYP